MGNTLFQVIAVLEGPKHVVRGPYEQVGRVDLHEFLWWRASAEGSESCASEGW